MNPNKLIIGGDWNCTLSPDDVRTNIDCLIMANIPNRTHTVLLNEMCERLGLADPYRLLYPIKRDYTYVPRAITARNRSRIDMFFVGQDIFDLNMNCTIEPGLQNKLFDHKAVLLSFVKYNNKNRKKNCIDSAYLKDDIL
jgi:exonuclease III